MSGGQQNNSYSGEHKLLWKMEESREMFGSLRLWPSFIGTNIVNERHEIGRLPVLVWSEQWRYIESKIPTQRGMKRSAPEGGGDDYSPNPILTAAAERNEESHVQKKVKTSKEPAGAHRATFIGGVFSWLQGLGRWLSHTSHEIAEEQLDDDNAPRGSVVAVPDCESEDTQGSYPAGAGATAFGDSEYRENITKLSVPCDKNGIQRMVSFRQKVFDDLQSAYGYKKRCEDFKAARQQIRCRIMSPATDPQGPSEPPQGSDRPVTTSPKVSSQDVSAIPSQPLPAAHTHQRRVGEKSSQLSAAGYFLGPGTVYGGNYCLYKTADPSTSHSIATVRVITPPPSLLQSSDDTMPAQISVRDLITFCRVQHQVGKRAVLAFPLGTEMPASDATGGTFQASDVGSSSGVQREVEYLVFSFQGVGERL